jgi:hypothetical protein
MYREISMRPEWGRPHPSDPNWADGEYHGMRMRGDDRSAAYGLNRLNSREDLGGWGGYDGRYDSEPGTFDLEGIYHDDFHGQGRGFRYDREFRGRAEFRQDPGGGGVHGDNRYLRQYNARSPELERGYDRGFGWAGGPEGRPGGWDESGGPRGRPTDERRYGGYSTGGFAEGKLAGPGTRQAKPNR